jgi:CHRD domain-containing protein
MRAGYAYVNVHTATYATGEIRGQINSHGGEKPDK